MVKNYVELGILGEFNTHMGLQSGERLENFQRGI